MINTTQRGRFITVEGTEGVGKSTNIDFLCRLLEAQGIEVVLTREPGGTPLAEELRNILLSPREEQVSDDAELLLMFAARAQHICNVIEPALARGAWVVSDRFTDATFAYQGGGRGLDLKNIELLEGLVQKGLQPDMTLLLDLDVAEGLKRASARSAPDRFEQEKVVFFEKVRAAYLARAQADADRFAVIDAAVELPAVQEQIRTAVISMLESAHG